MNQRNSIRLAVLALFVCSTRLHAEKAVPIRPNIVLILADDVSADMFTCYGQPGAARTPNIDRIAREGIMFRTCYAPAICAPSRALIMTGKYGNSTGVYHNGIWMQGSRKTLFTKQHSWAKLAREAGYATAIAGKWHCGAKSPWETEVGFNEHCLWEGPSKIKAHTGVDVFEAGLRENIPQSDTRYWHPSTLQNHRYVRVKRSDFGPDVRCRFLLDFMERTVRRKKPFLAYWPIVIPHGPYSTTPLAGKVMDLEPKKPDLTGLKGEAKEEARKRHAQNVQRRFVNLIEYMDLLVGKVMKKAAQLGIGDRTYFIFCGDNGTAVTAKNRGVERGCHVPFVMMGPGVKRTGPTEALTDFADVAPTLMDLTGANVPSGYHFDGRSLMPYLSGRSDAHREWIYGYVGCSQVVRTREYMLEAVNPMFDSPRGRFYQTGRHRFGRGYVRVDDKPEHAAARAAFAEILARFPPLASDDAYWSSKKGKHWMRQNATPDAIERHLHNHPDYRFYEE